MSSGVAITWGWCTTGREPAIGKKWQKNAEEMENWPDFPFVVWPVFPPVSVWGNFPPYFSPCLAFGGPFSIV